MKETIFDICGWIGIVTVGGGILLMLYGLFDGLRDVIRNTMWKNKYKHRFDKSPTAACYCKDCVYHGTKYPDGCNPCTFPGISKWTPDTGFCYEAEPITLKEAERREID